MASVKNDDYQVIDALIEENLFAELTKFVKLETFRFSDRPEDEAKVVANLEKIRDALMEQTAEFNKGQKTHLLESFEWKKTIGKSHHWLFGLRLGTGDYKITVCSHLDTVPPGSNPDWEPFTLKKEQREYRGMADQEFYVGRGAIDDKGPAIVAFNVLKAVAKKYDGSPKLDKVTVELLFDTAEETDMAMPYYLEDESTKAPDLGLIYDAFWTIRAEKGIERPIFTIVRGTPVNEGAWIEKLNTPEGPSNQIPGSATATIRSDSPEVLNNIADKVHEWYWTYGYDDDNYRCAEMRVDRSGMPHTLTLMADVAGAQHGSAPDENREGGANPLVSLANFLGGLVDRGIVASNEVGSMCQFISWAWGTKVLGEHHPRLLESHDQVFVGNNGTTYAVTRMYMGPKKVQLELDIRYAIGHHSRPWDGTEGMLPGANSIFSDVFDQLTGEFNRTAKHPVAFTTSTAAAPDIRLPESTTFQKVAKAYEEVMDQPTPSLAIGGGTDAKGNNRLIAAGALFTDRLGPPINFHGFNEGAPVEDLKNGARIIYRLFVDEIEAA